MSSTYSVPVCSPERGVQGRRTFCALMVMPRSRSMSMRSRYWARMLRPSTIPVTSSMRSASVDLPWSMWAMMQKFRMRAGSVVAGVVTVSPSSHARTGGTAFDPASSRSAVPGRADAGLPDAMRPGAPAPPASPGLRRLAFHPVGVAAVAALVLALLVEAAPVVGGDLMAQAWWATWASSNRSPVDLGWFGGVPVVSSSLIGPWLGALLGLPLAGIPGTVLGAASTTALLGRLHPSPTRLTAAGVVAAGTWAANQWSGRTTFGAGAALGCLALVVVALPRRWTARLGGTVLAALAGATSPVASVFLLLAAAAWWCGRQSDLPRLRVGPAGAWCLAGGALLPLGAARLLGAVSGPQPASNHQMVAALAATGLTYAVVPATQRILRIGVAGTAVLLLATWLIGDPVGSNSVRLVLLFAAPVVVAAARIRGTA